MATITLKLENISVYGVQVKLSDGSEITLTSNGNSEYSGEFENSTSNLQLTEIILGSYGHLDTNGGRFFISDTANFSNDTWVTESITIEGNIYKFDNFGNIPLNSDTTNITLKYNPIVDCYWNGTGAARDLIGKYVFFIHKNSLVNNIGEYVFTVKNIDTIERKLSYKKNSQNVIKEWTIKPQEEITFRFDFTADLLHQSFFVDSTNDDVVIFGNYDIDYGFSYKPPDFWREKGRWFFFIPNPRCVSA